MLRWSSRFNTATIKKSALYLQHANNLSLLIHFRHRILFSVVNSQLYNVAITLCIIMYHHPYFQVLVCTNCLSLQYLSGHTICGLLYDTIFKRTLKRKFIGLLNFFIDIFRISWLKPKHKPCPQINLCILRKGTKYKTLRCNLNDESYIEK